VSSSTKAADAERSGKQKEEFDGLYGGPARAHRTAFLDNDADWKPITFNARDAQLIDVHQHLVEEICRWFGVPPHKVMHLLRATNNNIEHQGIEAVVDHISPWVKRFEDEADYKLFGQNRQGLLHQDEHASPDARRHAARVEFYKGMWEMGAYSPNRILELEDENTLGADGDKHFVQLNLTTLERAGEEPAPARANRARNSRARTRYGAARRRCRRSAPAAKAKRTVVTKHDAEGRILEFRQEDAE
jgi:phage portal protein BeeE